MVSERGRYITTETVESVSCVCISAPHTLYSRHRDSFEGECVYTLLDKNICHTRTQLIFV